MQRGISAALRAAILGAGLLSPVMMASCATVTSLLSGSKDRERLYYVLRPGDLVPAPPPLPTRTDIFVEWHFDDTSTTLNLGFRGWDFDRNGLFEMVEVFDTQGEIQTRIFDFDGDGVIDETRPARETAPDGASA